MSTAIVWLLVAVVGLLLVRASMRRRNLVGGNRGWGEPPKAPWYRRWWVVGPALLAVGFVATGALSRGGKKTGVATSTSGPLGPAAASVARGEPPPHTIQKWSDAEAAAAEWMTYWGFVGAVQTPPSRDGGVDVVSATAIAQVKDTKNKVGPDVVQQLYGIATVERKAALFFARSGYTAGAQAFAERAGVALFSYNDQGQPQPENNQARSIVPLGLAA